MRCGPLTRLVRIKGLGFENRKSPKSLLFQWRCFVRTSSCTKFNFDLYFVDAPWVKLHYDMLHRYGSFEIGLL